MDQIEKAVQDASEPIKYNVLMMAAVVIECVARNEMEAAQRALIEGPQHLDPTQVQWVVRHISDKTIEIVPPGEGDPEWEEKVID